MGNEHVARIFQAEGTSAAGSQEPGAGRSAEGQWGVGERGEVGRAQTTHDFEAVVRSWSGSQE